VGTAGPLGPAGGGTAIAGEYRLRLDSEALAVEPGRAGIHLRQSNAGAGRRSGSRERVPSVEELPVEHGDRCADCWRKHQVAEAEIAVDD